jgi:DNA-binding FrmR family transcriptional regulator
MTIKCSFDLEAEIREVARWFIYEQRCNAIMKLIERVVADVCANLLVDIKAVREKSDEITAELAEAELKRKRDEAFTDDMARALKERGPYALHFRCPDCGVHVLVDDDGCCAMCGRDTITEPCDYEYDETQKRG